MQRELQSKGYNDIFIGNLKQLSPKYREYKEAMDRVNDRICRELGMYYDSEYRLVLEKKHRKRERRKKKEGTLRLKPVRGFSPFEFSLFGGILFFQKSQLQGFLHVFGWE